MGFRTGAYATVWEVKPVFDTNTKCRISISRRKKDSTEYEEDFSGYVSFIGTAAAKKAACLKEGVRIKLGDVDISTKYDKEKKTTYYNFKCFSFEDANSSNTSSDTSTDATQPVVDDGEVDDRLPF